jgi:hypothetical protein
MRMSTADRERQKPPAPAFVVLRRTGGKTWEFLGEVPRKRGMSARAARTQAILDATKGKATANEVYAAVLASEWRIALDWSPP